MYNKLDISYSSFLYTVSYNLWLNGTPYFSHLLVLIPNKMVKKCSWYTDQFVMVKTSNIYAL